jgi:hypothetical protein
MTFQHDQQSPSPLFFADLLPDHGKRGHLQG